MEIKDNLQGYLIYATMAFYLLAFISSMLKFKRFGGLLYFVGFGFSVYALVYRGITVRHIPLQNLFEVFLFMGMIWPLSIFCRKVLKVGGESSDMLLGFIVLFPAGFVFDAEPAHLPPALQCWIFAPHVAVYMISYLLMAKASVQAVGQLACPNGSADKTLISYEKATYRMICFGFPFLTVGLILGSIWGKLAWGDYWAWDPKELWALVSWLIYLIYYHFRYLYGARHSAFNSIIALVGMAAIIITLLWVNLSKIFSGLHSYA